MTRNFFQNRIDYDIIEPKVKRHRRCFPYLCLTNIGRLFQNCDIGIYVVFRA
jgi:hypothetical protein